MELTNKKIIKELLKKYNTKPEKHLGQHFILSKNALKKMVETAEINSDAHRGRSSDRKRRRKTDTIIEIGPGLGTLTQELAKTGANIMTVEKDPIMAEILKETMAGYKNIKIIQADARLAILKTPHLIDFGNQSNGKYKIVANLPYNIATFLIQSFLEIENLPAGRWVRPEMMILMIQKEVARRIVAQPPHSNLLAISVQFYADTKIIGYVKKDSFWPRPKVDAAIIKIVPKKNDCNQPIGLKQSFAFFRIVKFGFSSPRKQLVGNLIKKLSARGGSASGGKITRKKLISIFKNLGISEKTRAENLALKQWLDITERIIL